VKILTIFFINPKGKRLRTIWDMAAKVNGKSVNDYLIRGPNYYNEIIKLQFQMCEQKYIIKGDLREMFHQVRILEEDTEALRFLFRFRGESQIRHFKMKVLPFGAKCSPTIAQYVKNRVAEENMSENLLVSDLMINSTYVDDIVTSLSSETTAAEILMELKKKFLEGGFEMLKINSNSKRVIELTHQMMKQGKLENSKTFSDTNIEKILGYTLDFEKDTISVVVPLEKLPEAVREFQQLPTKRQLLQILMSIYDPKGYFQFITSDLKILYKKTLDLEWDTLIPEELRAEWIRCISNVEKIKDVKIPRLYCKQEYDTVNLHAFGDAGINLLCGVIYARFLKAGKQVGYKLIYAKTFIVPRTPKRTIPELELHMARNLIKMVSAVIKNHRIWFSTTYYYTDNTTVLEWITNGAKKMTQYQQNRLKAIKEGDVDGIWRWISTNMMPADLGTKNKSFKIDINNQWFKPEIFDKDLLEVEDPKIYIQIEAVPEIPKFIEFDKYSKYFDLITNVQIYVRLFEWVKIVKPMIKKLKIEEERHRKFGKKNGFLRQHHNRRIEKEMQKIRAPNFGIKRAIQILIRTAQQESMDGLSLENHPELANLLAFIDSDGIIKTKNRLPEDSERHFVIKRLNAIWLPKKHPLTRLIVMHYHEVNKHIMIKNVVAAVETKYYIQHIQSVVKKVIKTYCMWCIRYKSRPENPLMGDLPDERLGVYDLPFTFSMLDVAGPIQVKTGRNTTIKRYILVYTCLTTRAVNLELIKDMTTDATLQAINRTINRYGAPYRIITDNGTNFVGAKNKMIELTEAWNRKLMEKGAIIEPIDWQFGPARAPHFQGAVERMVGLTKSVMKMFLKMIKEPIKQLDDLTVINLLTEIMGILNSRPLSMIPIEDGRHEILTPNSFLMRRPNPQTIPFSDSHIKRKIEDYASIKESMKPLWDHWVKHYLPTIAIRNKWNKKNENLAVGDIVLTVDTTVNNSWRLGIITKIIPGSKDQVRQVEVKLGKRDVGISFESCSRGIKSKYLAEKISIVTRPATAVAKLRISI